MTTAEGCPCCLAVFFRRGGRHKYKKFKLSKGSTRLNYKYICLITKLDTDYSHLFTQITAI